MTQSDPIIRVIKAVANADEIDTAEVDTLYDYLDPEVLHVLDEQERGEWSFTFQFADHQVTVTHESQILIDGVPHVPDTSVR